MGYFFLAVFFGLSVSDYGQNNLHQHYDDLNDRLSSIKRSLAVIDSSLEQDLYELPVRIGEVGEDILQGIRDTNHDYGSIVSLIALGRLLGTLASTQSVTELSLTNALERVVGPTFITLSYAASRVQRLRRPELSCDLGRYAGVLRQYEVLLSLRDTYSILDWRQGSEQPSYDSPPLSSRHAAELLTPGLQPDILKHNVRDFVSELKKSLACVLDGKTSSSLTLDRCIDLIGKEMLKRLDLTSEYIKTINKLEIIDEKFNFV